MKTVSGILGIGLLGVAACATSGTGGNHVPAPPVESAAPDVSAGAVMSRDERELRRRVGQWWEARAYRDYRTMYALYENTLRKRLTLEDYRAQAIPRDRLDISATEVRTVTFKDPNHATVRIAYRVRLPQLPEAITSLLDEEWIKEGGRWNKVYFIPEPLSPPAIVRVPGAAPGVTLPSAMPPVGVSSPHPPSPSPSPGS